MNSPPIWSFPGKQALALASIPIGRVKAAERHHTRPVYRLPARFFHRLASRDGTQDATRSRSAIDAAVERAMAWSQSTGRGTKSPEARSERDRYRGAQRCLNFVLSLRGIEWAIVGLDEKAVHCLGILHYGWA